MGYNDISEIRKKLKEKNVDVTLEDMARSASFSKYISFGIKSILKAHSLESHTLDCVTEFNKGSGLVAATNHNTIRVNLGNDFCNRIIVDDTPTFEKLSLQDSYELVKGLVFHEVGHVLYTPFLEHMSRIQGFKHGRLSANSVSLTSEEQEVLDNLNTVMKGEKNIIAGKYARNLLAKLYSNFSNIVEDGRIERLLLTKDLSFGGYSAGLKHLRDKQITEIKIQCHRFSKTEHSIAYFMNLCLAYAKYHDTFSYDGSLLEFEAAKPVIDAMLETFEAQKFMDYCSKLLIIAYPFYEEFLVAESSEEQGNTSGNDDSDSSSSNGNSSSVSIECGNSSDESNDSSNDQSTEGDNSCDNQSVESDDSNDNRSDKGDNSNDDASSEENSSNDNQSEGSKGDTSGNDDSDSSPSNESSSSSDTENGNSSDKGNDSNNGQSVEDNDSDNNQPSEKEISEAIEKILNELPSLSEMPENTDMGLDKDGKRNQNSEMSESSANDLNEDSVKRILRDIAIQKIDDEIKNNSTKLLKDLVVIPEVRNVVRATNVVVSNAVANETFVCFVKEYQNRYSKAVRKVTREISRQLEVETRNAPSGRRYAGGKFSASKVVNNDYKYFKSKVRNREIKKVAIALVIDESGSMSSYSRITSARYAAMSLFDMFSSIDKAVNGSIDIGVYGHTASGAGNVTLEVFTDFGEKTLNRENVMLEIASMDSYATNVDAIPIAMVGKKLEQQDADVKMMFIISDGQPYSYNYSTTQKISKELSDIVDSIAKNDIEIIACGIGDDKARLKAIYKNHKFLDISDPMDLPKKLVDLVKRKF